MKANLPKVFGIKNDFLAEMLFSFISEHAPQNHIINYQQFFTRLSHFWPKKGEEVQQDDKAKYDHYKREARMKRREAMRKFMYEFIRVSGGKLITILDLVKLCCHFTKDSCSFGAECDEIMRNYKKLNIEPKYVHEMTEFGLQQYIKYVPYSCMIEDLEFAFVGQIKAKIKSPDMMSEENNKRADDKDVEEFPLSNWKMKSVFDETPLKKQGQRYENLLRYRQGFKGVFSEEEVLKEMQDNETVVENFDIINIWKLKSYLKQD